MFMSMLSDKNSETPKHKHPQSNNKTKVNKQHIRILLTSSSSLLLLLLSISLSTTTLTNTNNTSTHIVEAGFYTYYHRHYHHKSEAKAKEVTSKSAGLFFLPSSLPFFASAANTDEDHNNNYFNYYHYSNIMLSQQDNRGISGNDHVNGKDDLSNNNIIIDDDQLLIQDLSDDNNNDENDYSIHLNGIQITNDSDDNDDDITTSSSIHNIKDDDDLSYDNGSSTCLLVDEKDNNECCKSIMTKAESVTYTFDDTTDTDIDTETITPPLTTTEIKTQSIHSTISSNPKTTTTTPSGGNRSRTDTSSSYSSYSSKIHEAHTHYIFLVHGYMGNSKEMLSIEEALHEAKMNIISSSLSRSSSTSSSSSSSSSSNPASSSSFTNHEKKKSFSSKKSSKKHKNRIVIHSVTSNNGRTADGIANGGVRVAQEIQTFIKQDIQMYNNIHEEVENENYKQQETMDEIQNENHQTPSTDKRKKRNIQHISISFIGNSLGGLYSRFALSCIPQQFEIASITIKLHYNIFCTTVTPHLGVASNTFLKIPRVLEHVIGNVLLSTGRDLFRVDNYETRRSTGSGGINDVGFDPFCPILPTSSSNASKENDEAKALVEENTNPSTTSKTTAHRSTFQHQANDLIYKMAVEESFVQPLMAFRKRIAYINAFGSDFQVPASTAAFLDEQSTYPHFVIDAENFNDVTMTAKSAKVGDDDHPSSFVVAMVKTEANYDILCAETEWYEGKSPHLIMSNRLDAMGWYKVFIDTRDRIPLPSFSMLSWLGQRKTYKEEWNDFVESKKHTEKVLDDGMKVIATIQSKDMYKHLVFNDRIQFPAGHSVLVANAKSEGYKEFNAKGRPVMDKLAKDILVDLFDMDMGDIKD